MEFVNSNIVSQNIVCCWRVRKRADRIALRGATRISAACTLSRHRRLCALRLRITAPLPLLFSHLRSMATGNKRRVRFTRLLVRGVMARSVTRIGQRLANDGSSVSSRTGASIWGITPRVYNNRSLPRTRGICCAYRVFISGSGVASRSASRAFAQTQRVLAKQSLRVCAAHKHQAKDNGAWEQVDVGSAVIGRGLRALLHTSRTRHSWWMLWHPTRGGDSVRHRQQASIIESGSGKNA